MTEVEFAVSSFQIPFVPFAKIPRLKREIVITEKIDGTNASIFIGDNDLFLTGSRTRWITPDSDNAGFSRWAHANKSELIKLGPGHHFGEWWGLGIQRNYGLNEKRFSLFNTNRWKPDNPDLPKCVHIVPELYKGPFDTNKIDEVLANLATHGSYAYNYMNPEGIVIYQPQSRSLFKITLKDDASPKSLV